MYAGYSASSFSSSVSSARRIRAPSPSMQFYHFIRILVRYSKHLQSLFFLLRLLHLPQHFGHHRLLRRYRLPDRKHGILVFRVVPEFDHLLCELALPLEPVVVRKDEFNTREEGGEAFLLRLPLQPVTERQQAANGAEKGVELFHLQRRLVQLDGGAELEVSIRSEALDVHVSDVQGCRRDLIAHFVVREPEHELALVEYSREFEELAAREQDPDVHGVARRVVREADVDGHVVESLQRLYEHRGRGCKRAELQSCKGRLCTWHLLLGAGLSACVLLCCESAK
ncbi:hypothetical protein DFH11DRAFT_1644498 [Phellopilus nigrolimitatus]|nr:hypothetical protein DFH11DRAFT_1644498 [Phellopilus nigrolimitatus]